MKSFLRVAALLCAAGAAVRAELTVHPAPDGAPANASYRVQVRERGGDWQPLFVYDAVVGDEGRHHMGFVTFDADFAVPVEVRIRQAKGGAGEVRVRPAADGVRPRVEADAVLLDLAKPVQLSVEFDGDLMGNLAIFANPPEEAPIDGPGPGIVYYGPGVHRLGGDGTGNVPVEAGGTVYLAGGALVYGKVDFGRKDNVTIRGRGILCGARFNHDRAKPRPQLVYAGHSRGFRLEGLILLDAPGWNLHLHQLTDAVIRNVKILAWNRETDGVDPRACRNLVIEDCFIRSSDDSISIKLGNAGDPGAVTQRNSGITVRNCVLWPDRAHALLVGPEGAASDPAEHLTENVRFEDIDILRTAELNPAFHGALSIMCADDQTIRTITFENIRVAPIERGNLVDIRFVDNEYTRGYGRRVENIVFRNVTLEGAPPVPNRIEGRDDARRVSGVLFENLVIDGRPVADAEQGGFRINAFADGIRFATPGR